MSEAKAIVASVLILFLLFTSILNILSLYIKLLILTMIYFL